MSIVVENPNASAESRQRDFMAGQINRKGRALPKGKTALSMRLSDVQTSWLAEYATSQWTALHGSLNGWRKKLERYERIAENDRKDRKGAPDPANTDAPKTIFDQSNKSLGLVSGFADYAFAQARNDLFGTNPYFTASPQGIADEDLATAITRHAHWKFGQTNVRECFIDSLKLAVDLGTAFPKLVWRREIETFESIKRVIHENGKPVLKPDGTYLTTEDEPEEPVEGEEGTEEVEAPEQDYREMIVEDQVTLFDNVEARCIDFRDIAFDCTAPELSLFHTDVFHRFQIGLLDAKSIYNLTDQQYRAALDLLTGARSEATTPREHRDESAATGNQAKATEENANPPIVLVEGYIRCNPFGSGHDPIRIWCVFSPALQTIFTLDYLANQTPGGILPIYSIPWFEVPNRIIGKGYFERFEDVDDFIDKEFNSVIYRDDMASNPVTGIDETLLDEDMEEGSEIAIFPGKQLKLKPGAKLSEALQFAVIPDANQQAVQLLNMMMQMAQSRTGITSASQGELSGVPEASTATGVNQIVSRGATLLKWPIDTVKDNLARPLDGAIQLLYANQNEDETFTWAEGKEPELMTIRRRDVRGLRINVTLTMMQAQNQQKLQSSQAGITIHGQYIALMEPEKQAARPLYLQAIQSLGFHGADQIIREPIADVQGIAALLPPELQEPFLAFAVQNGLMPDPSASASPGDSAPPSQPSSPPTT